MESLNKAEQLEPLPPHFLFLQFLATQPLAEVIQTLRTEQWGNRLVGTPQMLIEQIQAYADAGVEELVLHWFELDNRELLRSFAERILSGV